MEPTLDAPYPRNEASPMGEPKLNGDHISFGNGFHLSFLRTLRIPDDGKTYPLPPGLGRFPIRKIDRRDRRVPASMRERGGFLIPMYQREALWISFGGETSAVQVGVGGVNAVSGKTWDEGLNSRPQNYIVAPDQPWLDGINAGKGFIRQFVAMPLGQGYTVEEQVSGEAKFGGMQIRVTAAKPGVIPDLLRTRVTCFRELMCAPMGLGAGGKMKQQIDRDEYGLDTWDLTRASEVFIHIVNSQQWTAITGEALPPTPVDAATYTAHGLPWFDLYRDDTPAVDPSTTLGSVKTVSQVEEKKGIEPEGTDTVPIPGKQVTVIKGSGWPKE